jgi:pyruvate formate lyase activating enzyme
VILGQNFPPESIVEHAREYRCASISYTYTEPTIYFELAYDTAQAAVTQGLRNVFVSNGYITPEALETISPILHAANIDLKGFSEDFYRKVCGAKLQPVLDAIKLYKKLGIWIEITTLIIPGHNDSESELRQIAEFIRSVGEDIPWHVSRFHPTYKLMDQPITPVATLHRARQIGLDAGLRYVYQGNVPGDGEDTACWNCKKTLVARVGFSIRENRVKAGKCGYCGADMDGVWE